LFYLPEPTDSGEYKVYLDASGRFRREELVAIKSNSTCQRCGGQVLYDGHCLQCGAEHDSNGNYIRAKMGTLRAEGNKRRRRGHAREIVEEND